MSSNRTARRWLLMTAVLCATPGVLLGMAAWLAAPQIDTWSTGDRLAFSGLAAAIGASIGTLFGQPALGQWLTEQRAALGLDHGRVTVELLDSWLGTLGLRITAVRTHGEHSQLTQMIRRRRATDVSVWPKVACDPAGRFGRLRLGGQPLPLLEVIDRWRGSAGPLVIIGEPGYGKTVAALIAVERINARSRAEVAELFSLSDWYGSRRGSESRPLSDWIVESLRGRYSIPSEVAEAMLVSSRLIPVLDGLDEVPRGSRRECIAAIEAFARQATLPRPFVLTCRAAEYAHLRPEWTAVGLRGLDGDQVLETLNDIPPHPGWRNLRELVRAGDSHLLAVFRSPLRLATCLDAYDDDDPGVVRNLPVKAVQPLLWHRLLARNSASFGGATAEQVRTWLLFLANGMRTRVQDRLWTHEIGWFAPPDVRDPTSFRRQVRVAAACLSGTAFGLSWLALNRDVESVLLGLPIAALFGAAAACDRTHDDSSVLAYPVSWSTRSRWGRQALFVGLLAASWMAAPFVIVGLFLDFAPLIEVTGIVTLAWWVAMIVVSFVGAAECTVVNNVTPTELLGGGPTDVMDRCRAGGLRSLTLGTLISAGVVAAVLWLFASLNLGETVFAALLVGSLAATSHSLQDSCLTTWLHEKWIHRRLARRGLLPKDVHGFLRWCAAPEQGLLRVSDAYDFRHREFHEYLLAMADLEKRTGHVFELGPLHPH